MTGTSPRDRRGGINYRALKPDVLDAVHHHIQSFKARKSHYSLHDNHHKIYLPETLNITKMFSVFKKKHPEVKVSYQKYRETFKRDYNISFGYPRSDTCSQCDEFNAQIKAADKRDGNDSTEISRLNGQKELHLRKAETFYRRKKADKIRSQKEIEFECIAMDYQKNVPMPNISTNDVYYRRQLSMLSFNIHVLSNSDSYFYTYPECIAKKGSDEVCSFLFDFMMNKLPAVVQNLHIYCDGAGGQNKNYTVVRFIHYMVIVVKRFTSITITYPVRGHSYLECDKNMGHINLKKRMETPSDWEETIASSCIKPTPLSVVSVCQKSVKKWSEFLKDKYVKKCPFAMQKMKEVMCVNTHPRTVFHRDAYNAVMLEDPIRSAAESKESTKLASSEFELPTQSYFNLIPISEEKHNDITFLSKFCESQEAKELYASIPHQEKNNNKHKAETNNEEFVEQEDGSASEAEERPYKDVSIPCSSGLIPIKNCTTVKKGSKRKSARAATTEFQGKKLAKKKK